MGLVCYRFELTLLCSTLYNVNEASGTLLLSLHGFHLNGYYGIMTDSGNSKIKIFTFI